MRLFVGLDLPWELRQRLAGLGGGIPGARWVPEANFHLTLRFIGEVAAFEAEEIDHALAALRARAGARAPKERKQDLTAGGTKMAVNPGPCATRDNVEKVASIYATITSRRSEPENMRPRGGGRWKREKFSRTVWLTGSHTAQCLE